MTIMPTWKICPICHKRYQWNPDVGKMYCPYCHGSGKAVTDILDKLFGKDGTSHKRK